MSAKEQKVELSKTINKIRECIHKNENLMKYIGISDGVLGLSLYYYYDYLYTNNDSAFQKIIQHLEEAISYISENYKGSNPKNEIIEMGLYFLFLFEEKLIGNEVEGYLQELDIIIEGYLLEKISEKDLDYTSGVLKAAYYFVQRKKKKDLLYKVLDTVEELSIVEDNLSYWKFIMRDPENPLVELGLAHGVSGVVSFLLHLYKNGIDKQRCEILLNSSINFILSHKKKKEGINKFNMCAFDNSQLNYQNLTYGDIGIGYVLYKSGKILNNNYYCEKALSVLENAAFFRDDERKYIKDANLIYGASGLYSTFDLIYDLTKNKKMFFAKNYWYQKILEFSNSGSWAGYNTYFNGKQNYAQLGFSQGIVGIGITLMASEMGIRKNYLNYLNYNL